MGVATLCDTSCPRHHPHFEDIPRQNIGLDFIWFEVVSEDCNQRCVHCYANSMPPSFRHNKQASPSVGSLGNHRELQGKLTYQQWLALITEAHDLGCRESQFIGGEPFLYRGENGETVLDLAEYARTIGYEFVEIFTNATLITSEKVRRIQELGLCVGITLFSDDPTVHDAISRTPGSHRMTLRALEMLKRAEVPTRVGTVVMRPNQRTIGSTQTLIQDMGFTDNGIDVLRPQGRGIDPNLVPDDDIVAEYALITLPNFWAGRDAIMRYYSGNSCLAGKVAITDTGDVLPCTFSRSQVVGNVLEAKGLVEVIGGSAIQIIWHNTKDNVLVCKDCEYRYLCFDCRPLSEVMSEGRSEYLSAPYPRCTYNPYTGEWGSGTWRVRADGEPYYSQIWSASGFRGQEDTRMSLRDRGDTQMSQCRR